MTRLLVLLLLALSSTSYGFRMLEGEFTANKTCDLWCSFKKHRNTGNHQTAIGSIYRIMGDNKPGGEWLQIRDKDNSIRWVNKTCGNIKINKPIPFDYFILSISWQPTFCKEQKNKPECQSSNTLFALHGLWPTTDKKPYPAYCQGQIAKPFGHYTTLPLDQELSKKLSSNMPGTQSYLDRHEWHKHGSCSGMDVKTYYTKSVNYFQWFSDSPVAKQLKSHKGKIVSSKQVKQWINQWSASQSISLHCIKQNNKTVLKEIRLYLKKELPVSPNSQSFFQYAKRSNCPDSFYLTP
ncbi:Ribonuclease I [invertebrate metagenome]|uniref:Ribonuclease I n=1 Tax=invertebrate metagenome TaxID=1711999 RepID=A0A2H9TC20_9ZZZZ